MIRIYSTAKKDQLVFICNLRTPYRRQKGKTLMRARVTADFHDLFRPFPRGSYGFFAAERPPEESESCRGRVKSNQ